MYFAGVLTPTVILFCGGQLIPSESRPPPLLCTLSTQKDRLRFFASLDSVGCRGWEPLIWLPVPLSALEYRRSAVVKAFYHHARQRATHPSVARHAQLTTVRSRSCSFMPLSYPQNVANMDLLEYLPQYRIVLCKLCKSAIHPSALPKHCQNAHARRHSMLFRNKDNEMFAKETLPALLEQALLDPQKESLPLPQLYQPHYRRVSDLHSNRCAAAEDRLRCSVGNIII
jgi:hypothetical protein